MVQVNILLKILITSPASQTLVRLHMSCQMPLQPTPNTNFHLTILISFPSVLPMTLTTSLTVLPMTLTISLTVQLMCTAGKNNLSKTIQLFQVAKRLKSHDAAHEARG